VGPVGVNFDAAKSFIVEGIGIASLLLAGVALVLIEVWGIKKIWHLMNIDPKDSGHRRKAIQPSNIMRSKL
jgi:hypothetical protein